MELLKLFFSPFGQTRRSDFCCAALTLLSLLVIIDVGLQRTFAIEIPLPVVACIVWSAFAIAVKRARDIGYSFVWLGWTAVPILGPAWILFSLVFRKQQIGKQQNNPSESCQSSYMVVDHNRDDSQHVVNDVTGMNPILVAEVVKPSSTAEIQSALQNSTGEISIGGGRFSMGAQCASPRSTHFDMRGFNSILDFSAEDKWVRVQSGVRWCDLQSFLDPHDLSVQIMQSYANFTIGGSLSVNGHGRYVGAGPLILSVLLIEVVLENGKTIEASPTQNSDIFYGSIGGYGALGIITEVTLRVTDNCRVSADVCTMPVEDYPEYFQSTVRSEHALNDLAPTDQATNNNEAIFHNADIYPPHYARIRSTTWRRTERPVTQPARLMPQSSASPLAKHIEKQAEKYVYWAITESPAGKWRREHLLDPLLFLRPKVHWRNYEAGYDTASLEPTSRKHKTYILQEYFVPVREFKPFVTRLKDVLQRHNVNVINVSIRHANADPGSMLAWAREEVFAFVIYYKQGVTQPECGQVAVWTRELIDAAIQCDGTYYLPYQPHASETQFHQAYPRAQELFALKQKLDPNFRFRNSLWNKYYSPKKGQ